MIFEQKDIVFQILDVFPYYWFGPPRNFPGAFDTLSYKLKADMLYESKNQSIYIPDHSVCYIPGSVVTQCTGTVNESISIHFKVYNYSHDKIEKFVPDDWEKYETLFKSLLSCWTQKNTAYRYKSAAILNSIFSEFNKDTKYSESENQKILPSILYIKENMFRKDFSLTEAAKKSMMSDTYFRKLFNKEFNMSPKKYVITKRMEYASSLIMSKYYSLQEIADMCGYADYKHFSVEFKKHFLISPSHYYYPPDRPEKEK